MAISPTDKAEMDAHRVWVGRRIMLARETLGLKGTEFARQLGIQVSLLWNIEHGRNYPNLLVLSRICDATGMSADYFLRGHYTEREAIPTALRQKKAAKVSNSSPT